MDTGCAVGHQPDRQMTPAFSGEVMLNCSVDGCQRSASTSGMCKSHYLRKWRHGDPTAGKPTYPDAASRFLAKFTRGEDDACWPWTAGRGHKNLGYGTFWLDGTMHVASRVSYRLFVGEIPDGLFVCHSCDNAECVNPKHLFVGTAADNNTDKANKGRAARVTGERHGRHTKPECTARGSRHGNAILDETKVRDIRAMLLAGVPRNRIAVLFGVSATTIQRIEAGLSWRHVI